LNIEVENIANGKNQSNLFSAIHFIKEDSMKKFAALILLLNLYSPLTAFAYGAIAVDDEVGEHDPAYGLSVGEDSKEDAMRQALEYCREDGDYCKVVVWFETCGAYASSNKYYGYGYGRTEAIATRRALEMCGNRNCEVVVADCE